MVKLQSKNVHFNSATPLVEAVAEGRPRLPDDFVVSDSDKKIGVMILSVKTDRK